MNTKNLFVVAGITLHLCVSNVSTQTERLRAESDRYEQRRREATKGPDVGNVTTVIKISRLAIPQLSKESKKRLQVEKGDRLAHLDFLKGSKTGIFKLINLLDCKNIQNHNDEQNCFFENYSISVLANSYSFRAGGYNRAQFADLTLHKGFLITKPDFAVSFLTSLGETSIGDVSIDSEGVKFIASFEPAKAVEEAKTQIAAFNKGLAVGVSSYFRGMKIAKDSTYVIRSSGYDVEKNYAVGSAEDVIVVFRVVRIDSNGDVTLVWKEIQRKKGQKLEMK